VIKWQQQSEIISLHTWFNTLVIITAVKFVVALFHEERAPGPLNQKSGIFPTRPSTTTVVALMKHAVYLNIQGAHETHVF
jgi:hypothetical protein